MIRLAGLEMHPLDADDRIPEIKNEFGSGMCNITRCCTEVCPEHIGITDNGIIPLKERVVDRYYDPLRVSSAGCSDGRRRVSMFALKPIREDAIPTRSRRPSATAC